MRFLLPVCLMALEASLARADAAAADDSDPSVAVSASIGASVAIPAVAPVDATQADPASAIQTSVGIPDFDATQALANLAAPTSAAQPSADIPDFDADQGLATQPVVSTPAATPAVESAPAIVSTPDVVSTQAAISTQAAASIKTAPVPTNSAQPDDNQSSDAPVDVPGGAEIIACVYIKDQPSEKYKVHFSAESDFPCAPKPSNGTSTIITQAGSACMPIGTLDPVGACNSYPASMRVKWEVSEADGNGEPPNAGSMTAHWQPQNDGTGFFVWMGDDAGPDDSVCVANSPCEKDEAWPGAGKPIYLMFTENLASAS